MQTLNWHTALVFSQSPLKCFIPWHMTVPFLFLYLFCGSNTAGVWKSDLSLTHVTVLRTLSLFAWSWTRRKSAMCWGRWPTSRRASTASFIARRTSWVCSAPLWQSCCCCRQEVHPSSADLTFQDIPMTACDPEEDWPPCRRYEDSHGLIGWCSLWEDEVDFLEQQKKKTLCLDWKENWTWWKK